MTQTQFNYSKFAVAPVATWRAPQVRKKMTGPPLSKKKQGVCFTVRSATPPPPSSGRFPAAWQPARGFAATPRLRTGLREADGARGGDGVHDAGGAPQLSSGIRRGKWRWAEFSDPG